jgi:hypothetical protein
MTLLLFLATLLPGPLQRGERQLQRRRVSVWKQDHHLPCCRWVGDVSILKNVTYIGQVSYKGTIYPGEQPPVVDERLWQEVNRRRKPTMARATTGRQAGAIKRSFAV